MSDSHQIVSSTAAADEDGGLHTQNEKLKEQAFGNTSISEDLLNNYRQKNPKTKIPYRNTHGGRGRGERE
jgi:hypothetical protein